MRVYFDRLLVNKSTASKVKYFAFSPLIFLFFYFTVTCCIYKVSFWHWDVWVKSLSRNVSLHNYMRYLTSIIICSLISSNIMIYIHLICFLLLIFRTWMAIRTNDRVFRNRWLDQMVTWLFSILYKLTSRRLWRMLLWMFYYVNWSELLWSVSVWLTFG